MKRIDIRRGLDILSDNDLADEAEIVSSRSVALLGNDYPLVKPVLAVSEGDHVALGDVLFTDRSHQDLLFCSPGDGVVSAIHRGARRSLQAVVIELDDSNDEMRVDVQPGKPVDAQEVRRILISTGLWSALRARPYNSVPTPAEAPTNLFVTAIDTNPLAPEPAAIILRNKDSFVAGIEKLSLLSNHTYVCMGSTELPCPELQQVTPVLFTGPHPAGLAGTHIHHLTPHATSAWHIGYQDVIAVGQMFLSGRMSVAREVSIAGPGSAKPRLLKTRLGAATAHMQDKTLPHGSTVLSGSPLCGQADALASGFLSRYHNQVWVRESPPPKSTTSTLQNWSSALLALALPRYALSHRPAVRGGGWQTGMLPVEAFDQVWPFQVPPAPLLRALLTQDTETASHLGATMLAEEDLALCSYVCPAQQDYGTALRETLRAIEQGA